MTVAAWLAAGAASAGGLATLAVTRSGKNRGERDIHLTDELKENS